MMKIHRKTKTGQPVIEAQKTITKYLKITGYLTSYGYPVAITNFGPGHLQLDFQKCDFKSVKSAAVVVAWKRWPVELH